MTEENSVAHFIKYNNTIPIVLGILFLSTTATFAASPQAREAVYSETSEVRAIDNSYISSVNLDTYPFAIHITSVTEDDDKFYIAYDFDTIDVIDYVWQDALKKGTLQVFKSQLRGGDLKEYAEIEFAQLRNSEYQRLKQTQEYENHIGVSQKTVATAYAGLVGKFIEPSEEVLPFYQPPPELQDKNNPLALKNPKPLVTWDENNQPEPEVEREPEPEPEPEPEENPGGGGNPPAEDACPDIEGTQATLEECIGGEEPPAEEPPAEEPPQEEAPNPEPEPEPSPEPPAE